MDIHACNCIPLNLPDGCSKDACTRPSRLLQDVLSWFRANLWLQYYIHGNQKSHPINRCTNMTEIITIPNKQRVLAKINTHLKNKNPSVYLSATTYSTVAAACMSQWVIVQISSNIIPGNVYGWAARKICPTREHGRNSRDPPHIHVYSVKHFRASAYFYSSSPTSLELL